MKNTQRRMVKQAAPAEGAAFHAALKKAQRLLPHDPQAASLQASRVVQLSGQQDADKQGGQRDSSQQDEPRVQAEALWLLALAQQLLGQEAAALENLWKAAAHFELLHDSCAQARCLQVAAGCHLARGHYSQALEGLDRALALARSTQDRSLEASVLDNLVLVRQQVADFGRARRSFDSAQAVRRELGETPDEVSRYNNMAAEQLDQADALHARGERGRARQSYTFALELLNVAAQSPATPRLSALLTLNSGVALIGLRQAAEAHAALLSARQQAITLGDRRLEASVCTEQANLHIQSGELAEAQAQLQNAQRLLESVGGQRELMWLELAQAELYGQQGNYLAALTHQRRHHALEINLRQQAAEQHTQALAARLEMQRAQYEVEMQRLRSQELEQVVEQRTAELRRANREVILLLAAAAESRDQPSGLHIRWVGEVSGLLARELGLDAARADELGLAAQLHDIGKLAVPDAILLKSGELTPGEWDIMRGHTQRGAQILDSGSSTLLKLAREIALSHHERYDGLGYPQGLSGEAISLPGRIVNVVDAYDALISERAYKSAWSAVEALSYLQHHAGTLFDPGVVRAFAALSDAGRLPSRGE